LACCSEYVFHYIEQKQADGSTVTRQELNDLLNSAYLGHEEFAAYTKKYSHLEAVAACERIQRQYFEDIGPEAREKLHSLIPTLYDKEQPSNQEQAEKSYSKHRKRQFAIWGKFGTEIKNSNSKTKRYYLSDLESFRGGLEADFTVAVYDDLDKVLGLKPIKTYNLPFILRRTQCEELSKKRFTELVQRRHPKEASEWLESLERQRNLLGYIHVHSLVEKANEVYFEISKPRELQFEQVVRLEGLTLTGNNVSLRTGEGSIQVQLSKRKLNCWISERNSFKLSQSLHLPPLFALYPLHAINPGGKHTQWSIAFGLDAFLLESIMRRARRVGIRSDNTAIFL